MYIKIFNKVKPSYVNQNSLQCVIIFPVLVPGSCGRQHTYEVLAKLVLPSDYKILEFFGLWWACYSFCAKLQSYKEIGLN